MAIVYYILRFKIISCAFMTVLYAVFFILFLNTIFIEAFFLSLQKGVGYHLDMFVVAICVGIHSFLGLPWYVAATVSALAHINSLKKESECTAPGEKPSFLGVRYAAMLIFGLGMLLCISLVKVAAMLPFGLGMLLCFRLGWVCYYASSFLGIRYAAMLPFGIGMLLLCSCLSWVC